MKKNLSVEIKNIKPELNSKVSKTAEVQKLNTKKDSASSTKVVKKEIMLDKNFKNKNDFAQVNVEKKNHPVRGQKTYTKDHPLNSNSNNEQSNSRKYSKKEPVMDQKWDSKKNTLNSNVNWNRSERIGRIWGSKKNYNKKYVPNSNVNIRKEQVKPQINNNIKSTPNVKVQTKKTIKKLTKVSPGSSTTFLKHLIQTDFLFTKSINKKHSSKLIESTINVDKKKSIHTLNILLMNRRLKMFIRLVQGLRDNKEFFIHLWCHDEFVTDVINVFLSKYSLEKYMKVTRLFPRIDPSDEKINLLVILGQPWIQTPESLVDNWVLLNRTFVVVKINYEIENVSYGFYKIPNELTDYKKLFFILVLISKSILNRNYKNINNGILTKQVANVKVKISENPLVKLVKVNKPLVEKKLTNAASKKRRTTKKKEQRDLDYKEQLIQDSLEQESPEYQKRQYAIEYQRQLEKQQSLRYPKSSRKPMDFLGVDKVSDLPKNISSSLKKKDKKTSFRKSKVNTLKEVSPFLVASKVVSQKLPEAHKYKSAEHKANDSKYHAQLDQKKTDCAKRGSKFSLKKFNATLVGIIEPRDWPEKVETYVEAKRASDITKLAKKLNKKSNQNYDNKKRRFKKIGGGDTKKT